MAVLSKICAEEEFHNMTDKTYRCRRTEEITRDSWMSLWWWYLWLKLA